MRGFFALCNRNTAYNYICICMRKDIMLKRLETRATPEEAFACPAHVLRGSVPAQRSKELRPGRSTAAQDFATFHARAVGKEVAYFSACYPKCRPSVHKANLIFEEVEASFWLCDKRANALLTAYSTKTTDSETTVDTLLCVQTRAARSGQSRISCPWRRWFWPTRLRCKGSLPDYAQRWCLGLCRYLRSPLCSRVWWSTAWILGVFYQFSGIQAFSCRQCTVPDL